LEKITAFRFDLFGDYSRNFWELSEQALFESSIMVIWRVAVDSHSDGLTLQKLKKQILQNLKDDGLKREFRRLLKEIQFEEKIKNLKPAIQEIRHNYIAHFNLGKHVSPTPKQIEERTIRFSELKKFRNALNSLFDLLCFGHNAVLPFDYFQLPGNRPTDIEKLLDGVARDSGILNVPEIDLYTWPSRREKLKREDLELINKYRIKFGLPEV
jgi:hypothetical protein